MRPGRAEPARPLLPRRPPPSPHLALTSLESFYIFQRVFLVAATNENNADVNGGCLHGKGPNGPRAASVDLRTNECE
ncbi:hypothetical protein DBR06_SOUSAS1910157 [Sousa chinensis]|uniref:Uncharacterized protein n=1 Tax=Sousa chinensis TaxID=103600 RepID=A0A484GP37_SOUCH|nr:hypothetical protein DBR06_SOUSAS1910157 [Sousa chinensis]